MSYSRYATSHWYTYWLAGTSGRDDAKFAICGVAEFTAKELRDDMIGCLDKASDIDPRGDILELKRYMEAFLADIDVEFPTVPSHTNKDGGK